MSREAVKKFLEGADSLCVAGMSTLLGTAFVSIANAGQASDLEAVPLLGNDSIKLPVVLPFFWGMLAARMVIGTVQTKITCGDARKDGHLAVPVDDVVGDDQEDGKEEGKDVQPRPGARRQGDDEILAEGGGEVDDNERGDQENEVVLERRDPLERDREQELREIKYKKWNAGVDLVLGRMVPTLLIGLAVFAKKEPAYLFIATEASVAVKLLSQIVSNIHILQGEAQGEAPGLREKSKRLLEPSVGLVTTASLATAIYGIFIANPDDPSSVYTTLGTTTAGVQLLMQTYKLYVLTCVCCYRDGGVDIEAHEERERKAQHGAHAHAEPAAQHGANGVNGGEPDDVFAELEGDAPLVQSPSMFQRAAAVASSLFRVRSGMGDVRFATLGTPADGKDGDILLRTLSGSSTLKPSRSQRHLVASASHRGLSIQTAQNYGAVGQAQGIDLSNQQHRAAVARSPGYLNQMWKADGPPGGVGRGAGRGGVPVGAGRGGVPGGAGRGGAAAADGGGRGPQAPAPVPGAAGDAAGVGRGMGGPGGAGRGDAAR